MSEKQYESNSSIMRRLRESTPVSLLEKKIDAKNETIRLDILLTGGSLVLCICTCWVLWTISEWASFFQAVFILIVSILGENCVSGRGYYRYTEHNCCFIYRVPIWIPLMWVVVIQGSLLVISLAYPFNWLGVLASGIICSLIDLSLIEPYFCRRKMLW